MVEDAQTHRLPPDRAGVARPRVSRLHGPDTFVAELCARLGSVERITPSCSRRRRASPDPAISSSPAPRTIRRPWHPEGAWLRRTLARRGAGARLAPRPDAGDPQPARPRNPDRTRSRAAARVRRHRNPDAARCASISSCRDCRRACSCSRCFTPTQPCCRWSPKSWPGRRAGRTTWRSVRPCSTRC